MTGLAVALLLSCTIRFQTPSNAFSPRVSSASRRRRFCATQSSTHERMENSVLYGKPPLLSDKDTEARSGLLVLSTVPIAWGSFEPATRFIYSMDPPIPPFLFSLAYYSIASLTLVTAALVTRFLPDLEDETGRSSPLWPTAGGVELGLYLFIGNALQVLGLETIPSDRAAFLLQLTTIFVPLIEAVRRKSLSAISWTVWMACLLALCGVGIMGLDGRGDGIVDSLQDFKSVWVFSRGDFLVIFAAISYSFHCIRLEGYAQQTSAVVLAASKAATETLCSALAVLVLIFLYLVSGPPAETGEGSIGLFAYEAGEESVKFLQYLVQHISEDSWQEWLPAIGATAWTGWVTVAYTIYAQSFGQSRVRPTTANLIYTIQPIWTAIFAYLLLNETMGLEGYVGGTLIGCAVILVTLTSDS